MTPLALAWIQFVACVAVIGLAGVRLIRYGDAIAAATGLSRSWVGLVMVATVTSLPELVTGLSSVIVAASPDMAVGDALGSCIVNLAILALVDVAYRRAPVFAVADAGHVLSAGFGAALLALAALVLVLGAQGVLPSIGHLGIGSVGLLLVYLVAMRTLFLAEQRRQLIVPVSTAVPLRAALTGYALSSAVVVGSGIWLPLVGVELARLMGWSDSFMGTLFVAMATSVPEMATTWAAVRIGAIDLAVANLLGSNLFDVLILVLDDLAYRQASLFSHVSAVHVVTALGGCLMSVVVVLALAIRPVSRVMHLGSWAGIAMLALYLLNAVLQYRDGR